MQTEYVGDKAHRGFYTPCLSYNADRVCWWQSINRFLHAVFVVQCWRSMLVTKHIHVSTRRVCRTMLTEYVGDKTHTSFYTPCLSYNADRLCWWQSTYMFLHAVFVVQCWQSMLVTKHIQVSTRSVCRTMLTEYVGDKTHTNVQVSTSTRRVRRTILTVHVGDKTHTSFYIVNLSFNII